MSTYFNVSGCVHPVGTIFRPALTINGKTWIKPQDCATFKEASDAAKAMVDELASQSLAHLDAIGWAANPSTPEAAR
jgi:hypothetical protein